MEVSPTDRRQGLKFTENAETVQEALARRAAGGKPQKNINQTINHLGVFE